MIEPEQTDLTLGFIPLTDSAPLIVAKEMGWNIYYLGLGVPIPNIKKVIEMTEPQLLMTMFVTPKVKKLKSQIDEILEGNDVSFMLSGSTENLDAVDDSERILKVKSPADFQTQLADIHNDFQTSI